MSRNINEQIYYNKAKSCVNKIFAVVNDKKPAALLAKTNISDVLNKLGIFCEFRYLSEFFENKQLPEDFDAFLSIGGDGTLLSLVDVAVAVDKPIIGVNCGYMGFLTMFTVNDFINSIEAIKHCQLIESERTMLQVEDSNGANFIALNDIVVKSADLRLLSSEIFIDDDVFMTKMRSDGVIFSSSTGSTAYNLSANGPVLHPTSSAWCMTPICPHDIFNRSIVFGKKTKLLIKILSNAEILIDGKKISKCVNLPIKISVANKKLKLLQPENFSYFKTLRDKFNINNNDAI